MNKKGFTLIELLAVIIILAVIALIATPVVLNVVDKAKKESNKNSAYGLIEASRLYYADSLLDSQKYDNVTGTTNIIDELNVSGDKPDSGEIYINEKGEIAVAVVYDDTCYIKNFSDPQLSENDNTKDCKISNTTIAYYEFGIPTESSTTNYQDVISLSGSNIFIKKEQEQLYVCIYRNDKLECFKNNYEKEEKHILNVFGEENCTSYENGINCFDTQNQVAFILLYDGTVGGEAINGGCTIDSSNMPICITAN